MIKTPVTNHVAECKGEPLGYLLDGDGNDMSEEAMAEVCRILNAHDALVEALEKIAAIQIFYTIDNQCNMEEAVGIATTALSAAKGGA